jgi:hypothetical protein
MDYPILETPEVTSEQCKAMFSECITVNDVSKVLESFAALRGTGVVEMLEQAKRDIMMKR